MSKWELFTLRVEAQENADEYSNEVEQLRGTVARNEEEKQRLEAELLQIKEMLQREVARADAESRRNNVIIAEYKQVYKRYYIADDSVSSITESYVRICTCFRSVNVWRTITMLRRQRWASYGCVISDLTSIALTFYRTQIPIRTCFRRRFRNARNVGHV